MSSIRRPTPLAAVLLATSLALLDATASDATVTRTNIFAAMPGISEDTVGKAATFARARSGHAGLLTLELEDDYDAVQIGAVNQYTTPWGIARLVVAPSASYGGDPAIGAAAYDLDGRPLNQMLPVQFSQGGVDSAPGGNAVVSLPMSAPTPAGKTTLSFATTTSAAAYGATQPATGWFAADGLGCIPAGATVKTVTATRVTLSAAVTGGCGVGQAIYFSPVTFGPLGQAIPAATSFGELGITFSDWVPLHSLPRTDGGFSTGAVVAGAGIPAGTTLTSIGYAALGLSQPLAAPLPAQSAVTLSYANSVAGAVAAGASTLTVADGSSVRVGQTVGGNPAMPPATHVASILGTSVTLDQPITDAIGAGASIAFLNTTWTTLPTPAGDTTLPVASTSRRALLHLRYFTQASAAPEVHAPACARNATMDTVPCEGPLGLPPVWSSAGGALASKLPIDGVNFVSQIGAGAGAAKAQTSYPAFFVRFRGRHAGATLLVCGGYQAAGSTGSVSGEVAAGRIGAAWASAADPSTPISVVGLASHQLDTQPDFDNCTRMTDALHPGMMLIQDYSNHNASLPAPYRAQVQAVATHALSVGTQPIIYLAYVEASAHLGAVVVASDVSNATTVPLLSGLGHPVSGSPTLVTGSGVAAGTMATPIGGMWSLDLSQPATLAAGTVLHFGEQVSSNIGTFVQLATPSFLTNPSDGVAADGIPPGTLIAINHGSYSATLTQSANVAPGTLLRLTNYNAASVQNYSQAALFFHGATDPWDAVQLDGLGILGTDAQNKYFLCDGCTVEGGYANDYGNSLIAAQFVPMLQQLLNPGQAPTRR